MRFTLIDRITELEPDARIAAIKNVSLSEEYLQDHFPKFPVLPGVFMLEAMTQASAWLIRASEDFAHSVVVLKEARNVKYADFLSPGQSLIVRAEIISQNDRETKLKAEGRVDDQVKVSGRLVLERFNLADDNPDQSGTDAYVKSKLRDLFGLLYPDGVAALGAAK
jgi:3-hydroxyacyl-[acyl-carrier-protein] dehydratase